MKFVGLVSGGKDSIYAICKLVNEGHNLQALLHIQSNRKTIDSYMFQTVGTELIECYKSCLSVPLFIFKTDGNALNLKLEYEETENDEVEDLYSALSKIKEVVDFECVSSGAILSIYQKNRLENVCKRLNIFAISPLYKRNQKELLEEMIEYGIDARIIKIAAGGLNKDMINKDLKDINNFYSSCKYLDVNFCGEGGEYETIVLDCPLFNKKISIEKFEILRHEDEILQEERIDSVFYMKILNWKLINKI